MKRTLSTLTLVAAILPFAPSAFAAEEGGIQTSNYVSFGIGMGLLDDSDLSAGGVSAPIELSDSTDLRGAFGWAFDTSSAFDYRAEVELGYQRAELDSATSGGSSVSLGGNITTLALSANGYVDWHFADQWTAYAGLGVGVNHTDVSLTAGGSGFSGSDIGYQWQGILGAGYQVTPRTTLFAEYRYVQGLGDTNLDGVGAGVDNPTGHHLAVGVRLSI